MRNNGVTAARNAATTTSLGLAIVPCFIAALNAATTGLGLAIAVLIAATEPTLRRVPANRSAHPTYSSSFIPMSTSSRTSVQ